MLYKGELKTNKDNKEYKKILQVVTLESDEIIAGQSFGFSYESVSHTGGGCAFLIAGSGVYTFQVTDGEWVKYENVASQEQAESLLQEKIDYAMSTFHYSQDFMKVERIYSKVAPDV